MSRRETMRIWLFPALLAAVVWLPGVSPSAQASDSALCDGLSGRIVGQLMTCEPGMLIFADREMPGAGGQIISGPDIVGPKPIYQVPEFWLFVLCIGLALVIITCWFSWPLLVGFLGLLISTCGLGVWSALKERETGKPNLIGQLADGFGSLLGRGIAGIGGFLGHMFGSHGNRADPAHPCGDAVQMDGKCVEPGASITPTSTSTPTPTPAQTPHSTLSTPSSGTPSGASPSFGQSNKGASSERQETGKKAWELLFGGKPKD